MEGRERAGRCGDEIGKLVLKIAGCLMAQTDRQGQVVMGEFLKTNRETWQASNTAVVSDFQPHDDGSTLKQ